jgi:hypothetical protein
MDLKLVFLVVLFFTYTFSPALIQIFPSAISLLLRKNTGVSSKFLLSGAITFVVQAGVLYGTWTPCKELGCVVTAVIGINLTLAAGVLTVLLLLVFYFVFSTRK